MIYTNILKPKFRNLLRAFVLFLVAIFSLSLYSCQTSYIENYSPEKLRADTDYKILDVTTKDDSTIYLEDYDAKYYQQFNESKDVIVWKTPETVMVKTETKKEYNLQNKISTINLRDILNANVEKKKINEVAFFVGIAGMAIFIALAIVYSNSLKSPSW